MVDFLANSSTITGIYEASHLNKLRISIKTERRGMLTRGGLTPAGQFPISQLLCCSDRSSGLWLLILLHPPYSPDLAPSDLYLSNHEMSQ